MNHTLPLGTIVTNKSYNSVYRIESIASVSAAKSSFLNTALGKWETIYILVPIWYTYWAVPHNIGAFITTKPEKVKLSQDKISIADDQVKLKIIYQISHHISSNMMNFVLRDIQKAFNHPNDRVNFVNRIDIVIRDYNMVTRMVRFMKALL